MAEAQYVTLAQLIELLDPVTTEVADLSRKMNALERQIPESLLNSSENTKIQYNAWSDVLDYSNRAQEDLDSDDRDKSKNSLKKGKAI